MSKDLENKINSNSGDALIASGTPNNKDEEELLRQLLVLDHVQRDDKLSQRRLAKLLNLNLSTVNQVIKRLIKKGYVKTKRLNGRSVAYYLTPIGFSEKLHLVLSYTRCTISFFANVRELVNGELIRLRDQEGARSVSIIGTGELAEAAYLSAREQGLSMLRAYDPNRAGENWFGHEVKWPLCFETAEADVLIHADISLSGMGNISETASDFPHIIDMAQLLSERLCKFARRIDSEDVNASDSASSNPGIVYG
ncbi:MAG: winged helix-turn-helix transcriptional regulator [Planctomycetes bacterium]|nr:winged helix-turn-helix transcriptional regulator [Planctomycetota bacterium]